ncbi:MAG TPA: hypothetical protein VFK54_00410 [Candidatus Limnocylindrales bacterium]|nr:hypothetical protein [Candidatus Limnocylindrales bacterium]
MRVWLSALVLLLLAAASFVLALIFTTGGSRGPYLDLRTIAMYALAAGFAAVGIIQVVTGIARLR